MRPERIVRAASRSISPAGLEARVPVARLADVGGAEQRLQPEEARRRGRGGPAGTPRPGAVGTWMSASAVGRRMFVSVPSSKAVERDGDNAVSYAANRNERGVARSDAVEDDEVARRRPPQPVAYPPRAVAASSSSRSDEDAVAREARRAPARAGRRAAHAVEAVRRARRELDAAAASVRATSAIAAAEAAPAGRRRRAGRRPGGRGAGSACVVDVDGGARHLGRVQRTP